ncbi:MAG: MotA/TolQ/ExbB proton channel family protein [Opitutales bacterium]|jgi:biopolymer transport protein ExbB|nr:MotA/TolQ/ExbB proton channel family protein [Opitutales bacterium]MDP4643068.1 MotA/TolQ/ExbB proton channel family protein [Opitutales bacterium]MDP4693440.1 MotA/TolQ/ExbB proton channel family protein [Opitutales bacterium]MDP4878858.1 MotA/TolQ/ExbB proton channel family protein [Opitutales bacterium]MDP5080425.1 MotA/TolQ/ExbB proton channel family protein [Opitutales bacterium]
MDLLNNAGIFLYPLAVCSFIAVFITIERLIALRNSRVIPTHMVDAFVEGDMDKVESSMSSVTGRIVSFYRERQPDADALNAFARLEVSRMERGMFLLEVVIGAAPLLGLLGTVTGLTQVFGGFSADTGLPDPAAFIKGIALALNTTILGLAIAIPSLAAHAYLLRRVESLAARISVGVECLIELRERKSSQQ